MILWTDCPDQAAELLARPIAWTSQPNEPNRPEHAMLSALSLGTSLFTADLDDSSNFWRHLVIVADAPRSQMDALNEAPLDNLGPNGPTACVALRGRGFHGQRQRSWAVGEGNLYLSAALFPAGSAGRLFPGLAMLPAVAVVDALEDCPGLAMRPQIKWVNDLLMGRDKFGGVLTTSRCQGDQISAVLFGVGLNVATCPVVDPTPFVPRTCALAQPGTKLAVGPILLRLLSALAARYRILERDGPARLLAAYRTASLVVGREVRIWDESTNGPDAEGRWADPIAQGRVTEIDDNLALRLEGHSIPVIRGRLALEDACRELGI